MRSHLSLLRARELTPSGRLEAPQTLEADPADPKGAWGPSFVDAISSAGGALVVGEDTQGAIWAHVSAPGCRRFRRLALRNGPIGLPLLLAGVHEAIHLVWEDPAENVWSATAHVRCARAPRRG
jgi:hypothetical protein